MRVSLSRNARGTKRINDLSARPVGLKLPKRKKKHQLITASRQMNSRDSGNARYVHLHSRGAKRKTAPVNGISSPSGEKSERETAARARGGSKYSLATSRLDPRLGNSSSRARLIAGLDSGICESDRVMCGSGLCGPVSCCCRCEGKRKKTTLPGTRCRRGGGCRAGYFGAQRGSAAARKSFRFHFSARGEPLAQGRLALFFTFSPTRPAACFCVYAPAMARS